MTSEIWAALIFAASAVLVAWMQTRTHRQVKETKAAAEKTVSNTEHTSNGFAKTITDDVKKIESHLIRQDRRRDRIERWTAQQIVSFDDRLLAIEAKLNDTNNDNDRTNRHEPT